MTIIAIERTQDGSLVSADSATLQVTDALGATAIPTTPVVATSTGSYSYSTTGLGPGRYQAIWTFLKSGYLDDVITRVFNIDVPASLSQGVTLTDIERMVARRVGPYRKIKAGIGSTASRVYASTLQSSLSLGSYEDQFLLRRGLSSTDTLIAGYTEDDRVRQIASYDPANGWLTNDRAWTITPSSSPPESLEIHYLDPVDELRPCVLDGLRRCFFWDEIQLAVTSSSMGLNANVSDIAPWILSPAQIKTVSFMPTGQLQYPSRIPWWQPYRSGQNIYVRARGSMMGTVIMAVLRPVYSLVNDESSLLGPNDDLDTLAVDLDYAAWAGVIEVWKTLPERIQPLTPSELRPTLKQAAAEFSKKSLMIAQQGPETPALSLDFGSQDSVIGNLAESL